MRRSGLGDLFCFPSLLTLDRPEGPLWRQREDYTVSLLAAEELPLWYAARDQAQQDGVLMTAWPFTARSERSPGPEGKTRFLGCKRMTAYCARL